MLSIYNDTIAIAREAGLAAAVISRHDNDLARQLRRAATSVALNVAEGAGVQGGNRRLRYATALGSARETLACFDIAVALDYMTPLSAEAADRLDKVIATLVKVSR